MAIGKNKPNLGRGTRPRRKREQGKPGNGALKKGSAFKNSKAATKVGRRAAAGNKPEKGSQMRSAATIKRLNMYKQKAPKREDMIKQDLQPKRIAPDRRWFGNTRVITQGKMQSFREELSKSVNDPFSVVLKSSKLPLSLLQDPTKTKRMDLLSIEPYEHTFGAKRQRKKPKLASYDIENFMTEIGTKDEKYEEEKDVNLQFDVKTGLLKVPELKHCKEEIFDKGTSKRIWAELYKVVDSSDVLIQVLDARDPMGTRCFQLEKEVRKNHPHKHIVLLLNKVDLIPTWATRKWVDELRKEFPCIAFHASITNPFGKSALFQLLRQFMNLLKDRKHVSVGFFGYPNVGKSSVINTLKKKKVCKAAPIPGETKVWQYIALTKKLYAIDCPGVVPPTASDFTSDASKILKGVVRAEKVKDPSNYIDEVLVRVKPSYIIDKYNMPADTTWEDGEDFLCILARKMGKLRRGAEPDIETTARIVLYDWQRGRIPFFTPPPEKELEKKEEATEESVVAAAGVDQSFDDLKCSMKYDPEDCQADIQIEEEATVRRRRDPLDEGETEETTTEAKEEEPRDVLETREAEDKVDKTGKKGKKRRRKEPEDEQIDWNKVAADFDV